MSNKYLRVIRGKDIKTQKPRQMLVDVYDVYTAFDVDNVLTNAVKKLLAFGKRGYKDEKQDLKEAIVCIQKKIDQMEGAEKLEECSCFGSCSQ